MHLNSELYDGVETVEFLITDSRQKYFFPELPQLRNKVIRRIEIHGSMHHTPSAYQIDSSISSALITLVINGVEIFQDYAISRLSNPITLLGRGNSEIFNTPFDLSKSYLFVSDPSVLTIGEGFIVTFYYQDAKKTRFIKDLPSFRIDYVEAPIINNVDTMVKITNYNNVKDKRILGFKIFNSGASLCYTPDGRTIVSSSYMLGSYLNAWDEKELIINNLPLGRFLNSYPRREQIFFRALKFDWDKCYIQMGADPAILTVGQTFYLPVLYID